jgi:hypothetical protein
MHCRRTGYSCSRRSRDGSLCARALRCTGAEEPFPRVNNRDELSGVAEDRGGIPPDPDEAAGEATERSIAPQRITHYRECWYTRVTTSSQISKACSHTAADNAREAPLRHRDVRYAGN